MASKNVSIKLNSNGIRSVLKSQGVQDVLLRSAKQMQEMANAGKKKGYYAKVDAGGNRASAAVIAGGRWAIRDNAKHNTLLKSMGHGKV
jgi:hypothetical protein